MKHITFVKRAAVISLPALLLSAGSAFAQSGGDPTTAFTSRMGTIETWFIVALASITGIVFLGGLAGKLLAQMQTMKFVVGSVVMAIILGGWAAVRSGFLG